VNNAKLPTSPQNLHWEEIIMMRRFILKPSAKTVLSMIIAGGLVWANPIQAHGGHVPVNSEFLHDTWHMFAAMSVAVVLLALGIFFIYRLRSPRIKQSLELQ